MAKRKNATVIKKNTKTKQNNPEKNLTGKGKKAARRLCTLKCEIEAIYKKLKIAAENLEYVIKDDDNILKTFDVKSEFTAKSKQRSMIQNEPKRIEFKLNDFRYYIDFTHIVSESDELIDMKGSIVYGANRTLCFTECILPDGSKCDNCGRIARCDRLEDKPLIQFLVNQHGIIHSSGKLDDEWIVDDKEDLRDLHLRAVDIIWKEALEWTNENILP